jgi:DNA polymerase
MSLALDPRQRAMLAEMGIEVWMPEPPGDAVTAGPERDTAPMRALPAMAASLPRHSKPPSTLAPQPTPGEATGAAPALLAHAAGVEAMGWTELQSTVRTCQACAMCQGRRNAVFGSGDLKADWLIVGDAPDEEEDRLGEPFLGASGQLLDNMLRALRLERSTGVYLTQVLKCRPPSSRSPQPADLAECLPYLQRQIELLQPRVILALGRLAVQALLQTDEPLGKLRGQRHNFHGVPVVVSFHPTYLLRSGPEKARAWADLCLARQILRESP